MTDDDVAEAGREDQGEIVALWQAVGLTRPWNDPAKDFELALAGPSSTVLAVREGGRIVGTVMVGFDGHRGWVYYLGVAAEQRGRGIARGLMRASEAWLAARGCPKIQLMVRTDNSAACGFYAAIGYDAQDVVTLGRRLDG